MNNMRRCKECGKLFQPKGREQYCSDIHYRPCPICGDPVEVKYLSDPPRRCTKCKSKNINHIKTKPLFNVNEVNKDDQINDTSISNKEIEKEKSTDIKADIPPGKDIRQFIGKDYKHGKGYLPGHLYELNISKDEYSYWVSAIYDWTEGKSVSITELFSSKISIEGHFKQLTT